MPKILVSGAAALDFVFNLDVMPTRPEKYQAKEASIQGGGSSANAAAAVVALGGDVRFCTRIADDQIGAMIVASLEDAGIDSAFARRFAGRRSSFASIYIDAAGERQIVRFRDPNMPADSTWLEDAAEGNFDAILVDTRWPEAALRLSRIGRARGIPVIIDVEAPIGPARAAIEGASHAAFSEQGLRDWAGHGDHRQALTDFVARTGGFACVTLGSEGVAWKDPAGEGMVASYAIAAVETLAAGDVWHGAFGLRLAEGATAVEAMAFANAAAALKCSRAGGRKSYPTRREVEVFLAAK
jgi:sulfofructose kinase